MGYTLKKSILNLNLTKSDQNGYHVIMAKTIINPNLTASDVEFLLAQKCDGSWLGLDTSFPGEPFGGTRGVIVSVPWLLSKDTIGFELESEYDTLAQEFTMLLGKWTDTDGTVYCDLSVHIIHPQNHTGMLLKCKEHGELAYWDVSAQMARSFN